MYSFILVKYYNVYFIQSTDVHMIFYIFFLFCLFRMGKQGKAVDYMLMVSWNKLYTIPLYSIYI